MRVRLIRLWALVAALSVSQAALGVPAAFAGDAAAFAPSAVSTNPNNIAPTVATAPHEDVEMFGKPRMSVGHPNTIWDEEDIRQYKQMLKTSAELRQQLSELEKRMDARIGEPIDIPPPQKGSDGAWLYPGNYFPDFPGRQHTDDPVRKFSWFFDRDSEAIDALGILYALTDNEKYARYARDLLLAYANLPRYGASPSIMYRWEKGLTGQILEDSLDLELLARGYDLIYNTPSLSPADRKRIHDELLQPLAWVMLYPTVVEQDPSARFASMLNNRGAIGTAAVLLAGYATDDQELVNAALYGTRTTLAKNEAPRYKQFPPPKDWVAATADNPSKGLLTLYFTPEAIPGGMWVEGSPGYSLYALHGLVNAAEAAWRHGIDLYRYNDSILKYVFDFPLLIAYPNLRIAGENDSHLLWLSQLYFPAIYEYGYRRYRDPRYLAIIDAPDERGFPATKTGGEPGQKAVTSRSRPLIHPWLAPAPPPFMFNDPHEKAPPLSFPNVNFPTVGFGVLRTPASNGSGIANLTLSYGPTVSHGHPDRLHIDLWALDDILMPSPGVQFPYDNPLDVK